MPSISDKQLEERLTKAGKNLVRSPSSSDELLPLLDQIEQLLSKVEQSPSKSMQTALAPLTKAIVAKDLLSHSDSDVKVGLAACISEITRITAPDAPYDDEKMKEIFQLIVSSFENLSDTSSRSHEKRATILETVAKVRSCVIMLDLECEKMIVEMFGHFFKGIRDDHAEVIFASMETIMTLVFEESEDISSDLIHPLLATLKRNNKSTSPIARKLVERVIRNCADKIRPYLIHALKSLAATIDDYGEVVASVCRENAILLGNNNQNVLEEQPVHEDAREDKNSSNGPPDSIVNSRSDQSAAEHNMTSENYVKNAECEHQPANSMQKADSNDLGAEKGPENCETPGEEMDVSHSQAKNIEVEKPSKTVQRTTVQLPPSKASETEVVNVASPTKSKSLPDDSQSGNDRVANKEDNLHKEETMCDSPAYEKQSDRRYDVKTVEKLHSGKSHPDKTIIEEKSLTQEDSTKDASNSDSAERPLDQKEILGNKMEDGSSLSKEDRKKSIRAKPKHEKDGPKSTVGEKNVKGTVTSPISPIKSTKDENSREKTPKISTKPSQAPSTEKASKSVAYGEDLVGSKVKVWWPKDQQYYEGVIASFDSVRKKHKILYTDGDEEVLNLSREKWEIVKDDLVLEVDQAAEPSSHDASSDMQQNRKGKANIDTSSEQKKIDGLSKRKRKDTDSQLKDDDETTEPEPKANKSSSAKSKVKASKSDNLAKKHQDDSANASGRSKDVSIKTPSKSKQQDSQKTTAKSKGKSPQTDTPPSDSGVRLTRSGSSKVKEETKQIKTKAIVSEKSSEKAKKNSANAAKSRESETSKSGKKRRR